MQKTSDYSIFKKLPGNREIDACNLKKITASLKTNNMLEFRPLLVNDKMEVIDGQHRLEAAKALGLEVYFTIKTECAPLDMVLLNNAQKGWVLEDYIHFHASQGNESYKELIKISHKNSISVKDACYLSCLHSGKAYRNLKEGKLDQDISKVSEEIRERVWKIEQVKRLIDEKTMGNKFYLTSVAFKKAFIQLFNNGSFDFDLFITKLNMGISKVHRCTTATQYYDMFKAIYNYRNQEPIE